MPRPDVSVIVPVRNGERTIDAALAALGRQRFDAPFEVVVVDDGSDDRTAEIAERHGCTVIRRTSGPHGAAHARNAGAAAASGAILAFTDADCEPEPRWLAEGVRALEDADLVQGAILPPQGAQPSPFDRYLRVTGLSGLFETANLLVRREAFDRAGGFVPFVAGGRGLRPRPDEGPMGEDTRFGWTVLRTPGATAAFCPEAVVRHEVRPRRFADVLRERRRLRYFPALVVDVPELRDVLFLRVFLSRRSAAFDLAVAGALAAALTRRPGPLLAVLPYLSLLVPARRVHRRATWEYVVRAAAADGVAAASLAQGSAVSRSPIL